MYKLRYKDMKKEFARKYSLLVDKQNIDKAIYAMNANESVTWLLKDLVENKKKSVYLIGKTLSGVFPEILQYNLSKNAIDGKAPMFYFYENTIDIEYFVSKLYACIRDIYSHIKMLESEKATVIDKLTNVLNLKELYKINDGCPEEIKKKAIKYHIIALISSKQFEVSINEIKRLYPSEELSMKHYDDRLNSNDSRIIDFMIANNGSDIICISTPICFNTVYFSYILNFDVQPYNDDKFEIFYSCSVRRWINEDSLNIDFDGQKSICFSINGSNKMLVLNFKKKDDVNKNSKEDIYSKCEQHQEYIYITSKAAEKVIKELCNKNFNDVVATPSLFIHEGKGFVGIPASQDIVGSLTRGRYLKNLGEGTIDSLFFFEKVCELLKESKFKFSKSDSMEILNIGEFSVTSKGSFDMNSSYIAGEVNKITIFYYYMDEHLKDILINNLKEIKPKKDSYSSFTLNYDNDNIYTFDSNIGEKKVELKIVCIKTELFQNLLPKFDSKDVDSAIKDKEKIKKIVVTTRKKNSSFAINNYRDMILDSIDKYIEYDNEIIASIVDIPDYHNGGFTYRDPYVHVKEAFMKEGLHVQIRNATEYNEEIKKSVIESFLSSIKDIYTKLGVYINFKNKKKVFELLSTIEMDTIIGVDYIKVDGFSIAASIKLSVDGLSVKLPKLIFKNDKLILNGSTSWEPIAFGLKNINKLIKDIKLFRGKKEVIKKNIQEANEQFIQRLVVDSRALYLFRNTMLKDTKLIKKGIKYVSLRDEVTVKHSTFKLITDNDYKITASCMVAKDLTLGNSYISTSTRPDTLQNAPTISSLFIQQNRDVRRARALLFDIYNIEHTDLIASLIHEMRKMSFSYSTSTKLPHPLYLLGLLGDEADKVNNYI